MSTKRAQKAIAKRVEVWAAEVRRRPPGAGELDETTLAVTAKSPIIVWKGKAGFGGRRTGQRRDAAFADRREEVGMMRFDANGPDVDSISVDDEVEWSEGPLAGQTWYVIGQMESSWRGSKRIMLSRTKQEVSQS